MIARVLACLIGYCLASMAPAAAAEDIPEGYPELDPDTATVHLVIATLAPGGLFPDSDEPCGGKSTGTVENEDGEALDTICIPHFYTPYWLRAHVRWWLVGELPVTNLVVSTSSHYGPEGEPLSSSYFLFPVLTDGKHFIKHYRDDSFLLESRWGELYLPLWDELPPDWLPCSVEGLRESIAATDFASPIAAPNENFGEPTPEKSQYLRYTAAGVEPRFAIAISRLRTHLAGRPVVPGAHALECVRR
jgi:hypothetical protein